MPLYNGYFEAETLGGGSRKYSFKIIAGDLDQAKKAFLMKQRR